MVAFFKKPVEVAGIRISYGIDDVLYGYVRVFQQFAGFGQLDILYQPGEAFAGVFV